ncbi:hypothetical protein [uncultured Bacteroides sp.]|uniref:hypothetical protein n=1 Tax=uncultured Bacteroides sp. TaxID=162156 RepID=UPI002610A1FB|nr:hypothetical protein [uncultured Bacteroides sp.]
MRNGPDRLGKMAPGGGGACLPREGCVLPEREMRASGSGGAYSSQRTGVAFLAIYNAPRKTLFNIR